MIKGNRGFYFIKMNKIVLSFNWYLLIFYYINNNILIYNIIY